MPMPERKKYLRYWTGKQIESNKQCTKNLQAIENPVSQTSGGYEGAWVSKAIAKRAVTHSDPMLGRAG